MKNTLVWKETDYPEVFLYVSAEGRALATGYSWRTRQGSVLLQRDIRMTSRLMPAAQAEAEAAKAGIAWIKANVPEARVRLRSQLERSALFGQRQLGGRRRAA